MREGSGVSPAMTALFASVLQRTQGPLRGFVCGLVGSPDQAADIVQDVFVDAWRTARRAAAPFQGDGDEPAIRRWLFHVAYRRAIFVLRHNAVLRFESLDVTPVPQPHQFYEPVPFDDQIAEGEILRKALAGLGLQDAACLLLNVVQGFTAMEIASILDLGPLAAKKRLSRAKHRLRNAYFVESAEHRTGVRDERESRLSPAQPAATLRRPCAAPAAAPLRHVDAGGAVISRKTSGRLRLVPE